MPHILLVDDDPEDLMIWERCFRDDYGWIVSKATGVAEALAYLARHAPAAVLLDRRMPDPKQPGNAHEAVGDELLEVITARWPDIAVIMLTHFEDIQAAQHATRFGAFRYFSKNAPTPEVVRGCRMAIGMKQVNQFRRSCIEQTLETLEEVVKNAKDLCTVLSGTPIEFAYLEVAPGGSLRLVWPELSGQLALLRLDPHTHPFVPMVPCIQNVLESRQYRLVHSRSQLATTGSWIDNPGSQLIVPVLQPNPVAAPTENEVVALLWFESPEEGAFDKDLAEAILLVAQHVGDAYAKWHGLQQCIEETQDDAREGLLIDVAHEICNPLQAAQSNLDLLLTRIEQKPTLTPDEEELQKRLSSILTSLEDAIRAAVDLRYSTTKRELDLTESDLASLTQEVVESFDGRMELANCQVHLEPAPTLPKVRVDKRAMRDALRCLLENAVEAIEENRRRESSPEQAGEIVVTLSTDPSGQRDVQLSVRDSGCGINREDLPKLFKRAFSTKDQNRRGRTRGVGLCQVDRMVRQLGGKVEGHSVPGRGAEFCIVLPAAQCPATTH